MITVSYRAEFSPDSDRFKDHLFENGIFIAEKKEIYDRTIPDIVVEMKVDASFERVLTLSRDILDGHVITETLKECRWEDNPMECTYGTQ